MTTVPNPTRVDEIADGIYRLATAIDLPDGPGAFSFNQYLIDDDEPLLFHTGACIRAKRHRPRATTSAWASTARLSVQAAEDLAV